MLAPVTHIIPLATIERTRELPIAGEVVVRAGQNVKATEVIAQANVYPEHVALDVARGLGLPPDQVAQYLEREVGQAVTQDSIIANRSGLAARVVRAPCDGRIVAISGGQVLLQVKTDPFQLTAGIPGQIIEVKPDRGAVIGTTGAWVQAVWGNGQVNFGPLVCLAKSPDHVLSPDELDISQRGNVMFAGHCNDRKALEMAAKNGMRGLILGSLATNLVPLAARMPFPLIVIDGFGLHLVNDAAFILLVTNEGREITVNAEPYDRFSGKRPEAIIPLPASGQAVVSRAAVDFEAGQKVRVVRAPYAYQVGTIESLTREPTTFSNGLRVMAAMVQFDEENKALVPLANLDVLG